MRNIQFCHPERSEESLKVPKRTLRFARITIYDYFSSTISASTTFGGFCHFILCILAFNDSCCSTDDEAGQT